MMAQTMAGKAARAALSTLCSVAMVLTMVVVPQQAAAAETGATFVVDGLEYLVTAEGQVSVGTGELSDTALEDSTITDVVIPETVTYDGETYTVTLINKYAFSFCTGITSVSIPQTVTRIEYRAFAECATISGEGKEATYTGLQTVTFEGDSQLTYITEQSFYRDYNLAPFTIPAGVTSIGSNAFTSCYSFTTFACEEGSQLTSISSQAFLMEEPDNAIGTGTPSGGYNDIGGGTEAIYGDSSDSWGGLVSVTLPDSLLTLGSSSFLNNRDLTDLVFEGDSISQLGDACFAYCTSLVEVHIPATTEGQYDLAQYTFEYCLSLETVVFEGAISAPSGRWSSLGMFDFCTELSTVVFMDKMIEPCRYWIYDNSGEIPQYGYNSSDPTIYLNVTFYSSEAEATSGEGTALGNAVIREGTTLSSIVAGMATEDEDGTVVYSGEVPELPSGYTAWAFEEGAAADGLEDSLYAYPINASDLSFGSVVLSDETLEYTGAERVPSVSVLDASGQTLAESAYTLSYEREGSDGTWATTTDFTSVGTIRVTATATSAGGYTGSTSATYEIAYTEVGTTFELDGVTYMVTTAPSAGVAGEVQVGDGENLAVSDEYAGALTLPADVSMEDSDTSYAVTAIGDYAFTDLTSLTGITLPDGLESIGTNALYGCTGLASVSLPASVQTVGTSAFYGCSALASLVFEGESITDIGVRAFYRCTALTEVALPAITSHFEGLAFGDCVRLQKVTFTGSIAASASSQFSGCTSLKYLVYDVEQWGTLASTFSDSSPTIYYTVSFYGTNGSALGTAAVAAGTKLTAIKKGLSVLSGSVPAYPSGIVRWAFSGVSGSTLSAPATATAAKGGTVGSTYTAGTGKAKATYKVLTSSTVSYVTCKSTSKTAATVPATVSIGSKSYTVTQVAAKAFSGKKSTLKTVNLKSKKLKSIGTQAFASCKKLTSVTVASTALTSIGKKAFYGCAKLKTLTLKSKKVKTVGAKAFKGVNKKVTVKVPSAKRKAYKKLFVKKGLSSKATFK